MCIGVFNGPRALAARAGTRWVGEDGAAAAAPGGQLCFLSWGGGGGWLTHGPLF